MSEKKLTKVEFTWSDGEVTWLEGVDAEKWMSDVNGQIAFCYAYNFLLPPMEWKSRRIFTEIAPGLFVGTNESIFANKDKK